MSATRAMLTPDERATVKRLQRDLPPALLQVILGAFALEQTYGTDNTIACLEHLCAFLDRRARPRES
jgi:hypothetical protein